MRPLLPIVFNQLVTLGFGIVWMKLVSEFIEPEINDAYGRFLTLTQLGMLLTHSGLINHTTRYWQRESAQAGIYARFLWSISWQALKYLVPLLVITVLGVSLFYQDPIWIWVLPFLILGNIAMALNMTGTGALNAERRPWSVLFLSTVGGAARLFLPLGLALLTSVTLVTLSVGFALHGLVLIGCLLLLFRSTIGSPRPPEAQATKWVQELREYGRPFVWLGVGAWLMQNADRWVVALFFGKIQSGHFVFATGIGSIIPTMIIGALMQLVFPAIFRQADLAKTRQDWQSIARRCDQITVVFLILSFVGLFMLTLIGPYLVGSLISAKYAPAVTMLFPAGLAMVAAQVNQFHYLLLQGQHNSVGMIKVMMIIAGIKTTGSIIAAAISWPAFIGWLILSPVVSGFMGRHLIRNMALGEHALLGVKENKGQITP